MTIGLKSKDALHIACAIEGKAEYFLTTDDKILKKGKHIKEIKIIDPIERIYKNIGGKMITDTELKVKGLKVLLKELGKVEAERFIALIKKEAFDYTEWQRSLWEDKDVEELSKEAMEFRKKQKT